MAIPFGFSGSSGKRYWKYMWELFPRMLHFHRFQDPPTSLPTLERVGKTELTDLTLRHSEICVWT